MITRVEINNYKLFDNFKIDLEDGINVICGRNGTCKSAFMVVLYFLTRFLAMPSHSDRIASSIEDLFPFQKMSRWLVKNNGFDEITIKIEFSDLNDVDNTAKVFLYELVIRYNFIDKNCRVQNESLCLNGKELVSFSEGTIKMETDDEKHLSFKSDWRNSGVIVASNNNSIIRSFGSVISKIYALHLVPANMQNFFEETTQTLDIDGSNFAAWRSYYAAEQPEKLQKIFEQCRNVIPGFVSINDIKKGDLQSINVRLKFSNKNYDFSFNELSDGQKALLVLYSMLENVQDGATIFIDEPENFLAPSELQPWLNAINDAWEDKGLQFIVISHNFKTLNWHSKEAIVFSLAGDLPHIIWSKYNENEYYSLIDMLSRTEDSIQ